MTPISPWLGWRPAVVSKPNAAHPERGQAAPGGREQGGHRPPRTPRPVRCLACTAGLRPEILPDSTSKAGLKIGLTRLNLGRSPQSAQMRRFRSIHVRFVMRILGLAEVRRTRNVSKSASLTANNFANKLHGTEENGAALNATPHLDAPNVLGLFGPARYTPIRSRAYFKTGALNHSATLPNH
jgi:hypothetical protein